MVIAIERCGWWDGCESDREQEPNAYFLGIVDALVPTREGIDDQG